MTNYPSELISPGVRRSSQELVKDNRKDTDRLLSSWLAKYFTELISPGIRRSSQELIKDNREGTDRLLNS
jgi:hypothetical protein